VLAFMKEMLDKFLELLLSLFPLSPFTPVIEELSSLPFLGYINWFLPVVNILTLRSHRFTA